MDARENVVTTFCSSHCGGTCMLKVHVKDGVITRIGTDDAEEPQLRACLRGRAYRQRVYAPDRLKYPLRRIGERGEGKFERVSWDEAFDTVAGELKRVTETYGPEAIVYAGGAGDIVLLHGASTIEKLLCLQGGCSRPWGTISSEGAIFSDIATYGTVHVTNTRDDLLNSRLIILWANNPAETIGSTNTSWYIAQARERGARVVCLDPKYTTSAATLADEWIPIRPGTDAAALIAMAYTMITENLHDKAFLDTYSLGFDRFAEYVLGIEDGIPKTPRWAEPITSIPADTIARLAREYATIRPAALLTGIAPGRTAYGEQYHRAAITLAAMTGNVGVLGGWSGSRAYQVGGQFYKQRQYGLPAGRNPVEDDASPHRDRLPMRSKMLLGQGKFNTQKLADALLLGKAGGYPTDYKLLFFLNSNYLNQRANSNKTARALQKPEFVVVLEQLMTSTAKFGDIVLPTNTLLERNDFVVGWATPPFYGAVNQVIDSVGESKSHLEIATALASRMGFKEYAQETEDRWLREIAAPAGIKDYDAFRAKGIEKVNLSAPHVAFRKEIQDPKHHRFGTPSGKIEIYSQQIADMDVPLLPPIPKYIETWESPNDPLAKRYPLQLISTHPKRRAHSQFDNVPWLRELVPQVVWISVQDAVERGIHDGAMVKVFNDRGATIIAAKVTERIMPGVVDIPEGAWYSPDENGLDTGGCANVLLKDAPSPSGAFTSNTTLVQVEKT